MDLLLASGQPLIEERDPISGEFSEMSNRLKNKVIHVLNVGDIVKLGRVQMRVSDIVTEDMIANSRLNSDNKESILSKHEVERLLPKFEESDHKEVKVLQT
mmetsp:Transcript_34030/g.33578  ORF Transcript_34030/g.33578 Transcript_34030/m.33578 type:complete len:101 (-) Transcript_34030:816-1118(-)